VGRGFVLRKGPLDYLSQFRVSQSQFHQVKPGSKPDRPVVNWLHIFCYLFLGIHCCDGRVHLTRFDSAALLRFGSPRVISSVPCIIMYVYNTYVNPYTLFVSPSPSLSQLILSPDLPFHPRSATHSVEAKMVRIGISQGPCTHYDGIPLISIVLRYHGAQQVMEPGTFKSPDRQ
jgi:hypothetical protein